MILTLVLFLGVAKTTKKILYERQTLQFKMSLLHLLHLASI